jgi:hypothetical protein
MDALVSSRQGFTASSERLFLADRRERDLSHIVVTS